MGDDYCYFFVISGVSIARLLLVGSGIRGESSGVGMAKTATIMTNSRFGHKSTSKRRQNVTYTHLPPTLKWFSIITTRVFKYGKVRLILEKFWKH